MRQITLNIGTEFQGDGKRISADDRVEALTYIKADAAARFGGFTIVPTMGEWKDPESGRIHVEAGVQVEILTDQPEETARENAHALALYAKSVLQQGAILVRFAEIQGKFI